jgi:ACT domain-containing protein
VHVVLSVHLPDRPGALGAVASRLGALRADITDITVARRGQGDALDEFHLDLPGGPDLMDLVHAELAEVDGVEVVSWQEASGCCLPRP